jgi:hypothetical protein
MTPTDLLTADQVLTEYPALSRRHLQTLRSNGLLPFYLVRHRSYYRRDDVEGFLASCRTLGQARRRKVGTS